MGELSGYLTEAGAPLQRNVLAIEVGDKGADIFMSICS